MVKFLKTNKAVIVLQGRYAGKKAVIVRNFDDGTRERPYGHCWVAGIKKYPSKVIKKDSAKKTAKKSRVKAFVKIANYQHLMPTRYTLDVDLKDVVTPDALQSKDKNSNYYKHKSWHHEDIYTLANYMYISKPKDVVTPFMLEPCTPLLTDILCSPTKTSKVEVFCILGTLTYSETAL